MTRLGRTPSNLTPREKWLVRELKHANSCFDVDCKRCMRIEGVLEDGPQYYIEDPELKNSHIEKGLIKALETTIKVEAYLESAPVPLSVRKCMFQLTDLLHAVINITRDPVYSQEVRLPTDPVGESPQRKAFRIDKD